MFSVVEEPPSRLSIKGNFWLPFVGQSSVTRVANVFPCNILGKSKHMYKLL